MAKSDYVIDGASYNLRKEFTLEDWEYSERIDELFAKIKPAQQDGKLKVALSQDDVVEIMERVLIPVGGVMNKESFRKAPLETVHKIIKDFFFICTKTKLSMVKNWQTLTPDLQELIKQSEATKHN
jgi:hypothetical protein